MDQAETTSSSDDPATEDKLTIIDFALLALLCLMGIATIVTLALQG